MIKKIARIDGNEDYGYAKVYLALIDDDIYVDAVEIGKYGTSDVLIKLDETYVNNKRAEGVEDVAQLLDIIRPRDTYGEDYNKFCQVNYYVKQAMRVCDITHEDQFNVGGIKGLNITNW